ncbi:MAG: SHIRT domain-containing protein [Eubacteriaceae bacterium]|nr:SHIRT domain-containing protein [Eubacteriaceae bacterium]
MKKKLLAAVLCLAMIFSFGVSSNVLADTGSEDAVNGDTVTQSEEDTVDKEPAAEAEKEEAEQSQKKIATVMYKANGGSGSDFDAGQYEEGDAAVILGNDVNSGSGPSFTREGYTFLGWSKDSGAGIADYNEGDNVQVTEGGIVLYAVWKEEAAYDDAYRDNETEAPIEEIRAALRQSLDIVKKTGKAAGVKSNASEAGKIWCQANTGKDREIRYWQNQNKYNVKSSVWNEKTKDQILKDLRVVAFDKNGYSIPYSDITLDRDELDQMNSWLKRTDYQNMFSTSGTWDKKGDYTVLIQDIHAVINGRTVKIGTYKLIQGGDLVYHPLATYVPVWDDFTWDIADGELTMDKMEALGNSESRYKREDNGYVFKAKALKSQPGEQYLNDINKAIDEGRTGTHQVSVYDSDLSASESAVSLIFPSTFKVTLVDSRLNVNYDFVSGTIGKTLPSEVTALLPHGSRVAKNTAVTAIEPAETQVKVDGGVWTFKGWDNSTLTAVDSDILFTGTWTYAENAPTKKNNVSKSVDKTVRTAAAKTGGTKNGETKTGDDSSMWTWIVMLLAGAGAAAFRRRKTNK